MLLMSKSLMIAVVITSILQASSHWLGKPTLILKTISRGAAERCMLYCNGKKSYRETMKKEGQINIEIYI